MGLGDMSLSRSLSVGENEIIIKKSYYTNTNVSVSWNNLASGEEENLSLNYSLVVHPQKVVRCVLLFLFSMGREVQDIIKLKVPANM